MGGMADERWVLHVDMDAFFAAIEQLDQPQLRGKPILVGHDRPRGVVTTASYEARPFGCRSAQPIVVAKRLCPQAIVVPVRGQRYREISDRLFLILEQFSPLVEPLSIDEAFLDITGSERLFGPPAHLASLLKQRIFDELNLTASVGLAPNKFLAKIASDLDKPDGTTVIGPDDIDRLLPLLPVTRIWGVGPSTAAKLESMRVSTIGDLRSVPMEQLRRLFGADAERFYRLARGRDDRPVVPDTGAKSIGHECTFETDVGNPDEVRRVLLDHVEMVGRRLRRHGLEARTLSLKIRYGDFQTITRSATLERASASTSVLWRTARELFDRWAASSFVAVRLIGVSASNLVSGDSQCELFPDPERLRDGRLDGAADKIIDRFGRGAIRRGLSWGADPQVES